MQSRTFDKELALVLQKLRRLPTTPGKSCVVEGWCNDVDLCGCDSSNSEWWSRFWQGFHKAAGTSHVLQIFRPRSFAILGLLGSWNKPKEFDRQHQSCWGKVDPGETVKEAAIREFYEETGISLSPENLQPVFKRECLGETDYETTTFLVYQSMDSSAKEIPEIPESPEKGIEIRWVTWNELLNQNNSFYEYNLRLYANVAPFLSQNKTPTS